MRLREMTPADWPEVRRIYAAGLEGGDATFETEVPDYALWDRRHLPRCRWVMEEEGDGLAGFIAVSPVSPRAAYAGVAELSVYVDPARRRRGVGEALMKALIESAPAAGFWTLQAVVLEGNLASLRLHERCGFRTVGRRERIARDKNGHWRDTILMERRL